MRLVTSVSRHLPKGTHSLCIRDIMTCLTALTAAYLLFVISLAYGSENCQRNQFQCNNGFCIIRSWRCDKENDCKDNSDEEYCELDSGVNRRYVPRRKCPSNYFACSDYHCIPNVWKCDGIKDCADSRDENECEPAYCDMPNIFTCQNGLCISRTLVCNDVNDCKDGSDEKDCVTGILALPEVNSRRQKAANWLISKRNTQWGWNENTPRAIIAMYLSGSASFNGTNKEEELMAKQLELKVSISLLRNESDQLTPSILTQYINALLVTCHNPHNFYGLNLVTILKKQIQNNRNKTHPLAYLTLCNANDTVSVDDVNFLFEILNSKSEFPFWTDVQAVAVMALSCITKQSIYEYHSPNVTLATTRLKNQQHSDGSFGNIYTTAVVVQALLANGHEEDEDWNLKAAISFLKSKQKFSDGSFGDFLATYWILPIFNGKSLTSISYVQCGNLRKQRDGNPHEIVKSKLGPKIYVQYSLYIGNDLDIVHSISLRIPLNISIYNVMQLASEADPKYKFKEKRMLDKMYIYSISDRANDPETGMFWLLYLSNLQNNGTASLSTEGPDKVIVSSGEHIIMWYKLADIRQK